MVYGAFVLFFDVLMTPFLRDSTSLGKTVRIVASIEGVLVIVPYLIVSLLPSSQASSNGPAPAELLLEGTLSLEGRIKSIVIHDSELRGKTDRWAILEALG